MKRPKKIPGRLSVRGITPEQYAEAKARGLRWCSGHLQFEPVGNFWKTGGYCKESARDRHKEYWQTVTAERKEFYSRHQKEPESYEKGRAYRKRYWAALSPEDRAQRAFENRLWTRFRVRLAWFEAKLAEQGNCCATCDKPMGERRFAVDHDHTCCPGRKSCGKCVRGLVCDKCNLYLGMLEELMTKGDWILKGQAYLARYKEN